MNGALVTGSGQRIGRCIAQTLAADGWHVTVHYNVSRDASEDTVRAIVDAGGKAKAVQADLSCAQSCVELIKVAGGEASGLTCLINNASVFIEDRIVDVDVASFNRSMAVNLRAPVLLSQAFAEQLPLGEDGVIINILDQKLANTNPDFLSYSLSKYGLLGLTNMLAMALGPRIRVCGVAPGLTLPSGDQSQDQFHAIHTRTPLARGSAPENIADAVRYLVGARAVTGEVIMVDGGQHLVRSERDVMFQDPSLDQESSR
ncbi:MAG: SDR family oxidoreductase [Alphaproteobacteria bacterium]|nr:SDR family oxidoreductase [Alphaproteobacteria bacterium]